MIGPDEHIVGFDCERTVDEPIAGDILRALVDAYPGYQWFVLIRGGVIQVKVMNWSQNWGMVLHYVDVAHDANDRRRSTIRAAGEFLERANMIRGRAQERAIQKIEGVPDKYIERARL